MAISKEDFCERLNVLKKCIWTYDNLLTSLEDMGIVIDYANSPLYMLEDDYVNLLEKAIEVSETKTPDWDGGLGTYVYELNFGKIKNDRPIISEDKDGNKIEFYLNSPEEVYDYLMWIKGGN